MDDGWRSVGGLGRVGRHGYEPCATERFGAPAPPIAFAAAAAREARAAKLAPRTYLDALKILKFYKISRHIESLNTCIKY